MKETLKKYIAQILQDYAGQFSSKRAVIFGSFIMLVIGFFANLFFGYTIQEFVWDAPLYIVLGGLGFTTLEPLTLNKKDRNDG